MNLSYWEKTSFLTNYDFVIIGSGIVGCFAALRLREKNPSAKICILERGILPSGASTKNAGFATFGTVSELLENLKRADENTVITLTQRRWRGLQKMIHTLGKDHIGLENSGGYELFRDEDEALFGLCEQNVSYINRLIGEVITSDKSSEIFRIDHKKADGFGFRKVKHIISNSFEASIDTGKMMYRLTNLVQQNGIHFFNGCDVHSFENQTSKVIIHTPAGAIETKKLIIATNAFAKQLLPGLDVIPGRGQVLVTKPIKDLKLKGTFHFDKGYYYFRNIDDRVLFGGGRNLDMKKEETYEFGSSEAIRSSLLHYLQEMVLPDQNFEIDLSWSGIMGFGNELNPIIKEVEKNIFCAVRCNGMGVAMGSILGEEVADLAL